MKKILFFLGISFNVGYSFGQNTNEFYTKDIDNFWNAYDSVKSTTNTTLQLNFIQTLYLNKASEGLKELIKLRGHTAQKHRENILNYPKFWESIRQNTLQIKSHFPEFNSIINRFKKIYPRFKPVKIYFTIGILNSGGTIYDKNILIGAEIACAGKETNASELNPWLQDVFRTKGTVTEIVAHELGHTQQSKTHVESLLGQSIKEGACDFLAELIYNPIHSPYMVYGEKNEKHLWYAFKKDMNNLNFKNWLYNGNDTSKTVADLGYYIGYSICKSYYLTKRNRKRAIRKIIRVKYDHKSVVKFLIKSQYNEMPKN